MVNRLYVEKRENHEAAALLRDLRSFLGLDRLEGLRMLNRYDVENMDPALLARCKTAIFAEPPLDDVFDDMPEAAGVVFAVEALPGQFDQRADSAAQCVQLLSMGERPLVAAARVYILEGNVTDEDIAAVKRYVINPVECREASLAKPDTLKMTHPKPEMVKTLHGFLTMDEAARRDFLRAYGLAMDLSDLAFCQAYFRREGREPTETEIRVIDTYWSDHCRHTTFLTELTDITFADERAKAAYEDYLAMRALLGITKPITLMDLATIGGKYLRHVGKLTNLDESEEINACTVKVTALVDGREEPWLLLFKNETHNHPTEIEPFGGAATCLGGAIRDPLSGRAYVYQAMRVTGAANPLMPIGETIPGKLPQRKLTTTAAAGYSAYGNQVGLATGLVDEIYHEGYAAKRLEVGAVVGAAPAHQVRREVPAPGDRVILLGGRTGRDGCGGATGSSKSHTADSLTTCGAEVQKGNAPEERKIQRLFRNPEASRLIKRCNDFGAGGVSVAIGELADGLHVSLDAIPKKYEGLDGTELSISESQERMAVVLAPEDVDAFTRLAAEENLEATPVAVVTAEPRLIMTWQGRDIVNLTRDFMNSNGAPKTATAHISAMKVEKPLPPFSFAAGLKALVRDLNMASKRGLAERFDATIGAGTVLMPFGGKRQLTPPQAMAAKLPVLTGETTTCSVMAYGYNPRLMAQSPMEGAYLAVVESVAKLVATGAGYEQAHLTFQEYFERMEKDNWHKPLSALLGALMAQKDLGLAAVGGKDSMSGTFEALKVPPTLISFAVTIADGAHIISPEFKGAGHRVCLVTPGETPGGLLDTFALVTRLIREGKVLSAYTPGDAGVMGGLFTMCLGNGLGFAFDEGVDPLSLFSWQYGAFILETEEPVGVTLGYTTADYTLAAGGERISLKELETQWANTLEGVFPAKAAQDGPVETLSHQATAWPAPAIKAPRPRVLIPVFPGTNCEYDTAAAFEKAGAEAHIFVVNNLSAQGVMDSAAGLAQGIVDSQILFLPGGFSGGDEPDGSGKFITAFLRNPRIADAMMDLLQRRDGLIGGICNGFQALIKLGLLPYGDIREPETSAPTLTYNAIGRHQSRLVHTRVSSNKSPWLSMAQMGDVHLVPISHGEGRFVCGEGLLHQLIQNGQIATQYVDDEGKATMDILFNPNGSAMAVEGITSPDGRIFGRMAHAERAGQYLYKNVPGQHYSPMFAGGVAYFK